MATRLPCCVCGGATFVPLQSRADEIMVLRCRACGMGVVEKFPDDALGLYGDSYYYSSGRPSEMNRSYSNYELVAEHGVTWAASLVELIRPRGRILDVGCADGYLLNKLELGFERYGIEVNA